MRRRAIGVVGAVVCAILALAGTAGGISGGTPDTTIPYKFPAVALIEVYGFFGDYWQPACTGTLIAPDELVTAGHCVLPLQFGIVSASDYRITFDPSPSNEVFWPDRDTSTHFSVLSGVTHPDYPAAAVGVVANAKPTYATAPDVAVLKLAARVPASIATPMLIVAADALNSSKGLDLTAVGFGANGFHPAKTWLWDGYRNYRETTVIGDHEVTSPLYLKVASVSCSGDSGGPVVLDGKIAGVTSFGESSHCDSPDYYTRLDTASVQTFLADPGL